MTSGLSCKKCESGRMVREPVFPEKGERVDLATAGFVSGENIARLSLMPCSRKDLMKRLERIEALSGIGSWQMYPGRKVMLWSDEMYNIFGVSRQSFVSSLENVFSMISASDRGRVEQVFQRAVIEGREYEVEKVCVNRPDGSSVYVDCKIYCEENQDGGSVVFSGLVQKVPAFEMQEVLSQGLWKKNAGGKQAEVARTQFLANVSHELKTPLNSIIGFSEMIREKLSKEPVGDCDEGGRKDYFCYLDGIRKSSSYLLGLINDILDMSRIEEGSYSLELRRMRPVDVLGVVVQMARHRADEHGVSIDYKVCDGCRNVEMVADRHAFMQAVLNIVSNSVKFSDAGGEVIVALKESDDGRAVCITVTDNGIGMDTGKIEEAIAPFGQLVGESPNHYSRSHDGVGLGLSIAKELVELHGGSIGVESTPGEGTSVTMVFPKDQDFVKNNCFAGQL